VGPPLECWLLFHTHSGPFPGFERMPVARLPPTAVAIGTPFLGRSASMPLVRVIDPSLAVVRQPCLIVASTPRNAR